MNSIELQKYEILFKLWYKSEMRARQSGLNFQKILKNQIFLCSVI